MLGRATLRTLTAVDQGGRPQHGPESYVQAVSQVLPGWVISLLAGALLLPVLVASVDAFARARRRHVDVLPWLRWVAAWVAPFLAALALASSSPWSAPRRRRHPRPCRRTCCPWTGPRSACSRGWPWRWCSPSSSRAGWRPGPTRRCASRSSRGPGVALALAIATGSLLLWLVNPYAGLLAVPAAHLWMLTVLTRPMPPRRLRAVLIGVGVAPAALVAIYYMFALSVDPLHGAWYLLMLLTGHSVGTCSR